VRQPVFLANEALGQIDPQLPAHGARHAFQRFQNHCGVVRIEQTVGLGTAGLEPLGELHLAVARSACVDRITADLVGALSEPNVDKRLGADLSLSGDATQIPHQLRVDADQGASSRRGKGHLNLQLTTQSCHSPNAASASVNPGGHPPPPPPPLASRRWQRARY
jgi:hypothetical protein